MKLKKLTLMIVMAALTLCACPMMLGNNVYAQNSSTLGAVTPPTTDGDSITQGTDIPDTVLYEKLESQLQLVKGQAIKSNRFWDFETLDLSSNPYTDKKITNLTGLNNLDFRSLKVLKLNYNNIETIDKTVFKSMPNLETIEIVNSGVTSIDLSGLTKLHSINLAQNKISNISLTKLVTDGSTYTASGYYDKPNTTWATTTSNVSYVNLSSNLIDNIDDIKLPAENIGTKCEVVLYDNNIANYDNSMQYYDIKLGLQGLNTQLMDSTTDDDDNTTYYLYRSSHITYYNVGDDKWQVKFTRKFKENGVERVQEITLSDSSEHNYTTLTLENGDYTMDVYYDGALLDYDSTANTMGWKHSEFKVIPTLPGYYYEVKGVRYDEIVKLDKVSTIVFTADKDATIYYRIGNGDWVKGNSLTISKGGYQTVYVKSVVGDYESQERMIIINASTSLHIPAIMIIMLVVCGILVLVFVVTPLMRKYIVRS